MTSRTTTIKYTISGYYTVTVIYPVTPTLTPILAQTLHVTHNLTHSRTHSHTESVPSTNFVYGISG